MGPLRRTVTAGTRIDLNAMASTDPDGDELSFRWQFYPEPSTYSGALRLENADTPVASFRAPMVKGAQSIHIILTVTDSGVPPLSRYQRLIVTAAD